MNKENILPHGKDAFTLVELIIVITILAILALIAFISFRNYSGNARDGNKLMTLSSMEKGLSLYQIKTGNYPTPDALYGSGTYSGILLSQVGLVGSGVVQAINMNKIPKDPIVNFEYTYSLSNDKKYYQLGVVLETSEMTFIQQMYANTYTSKVVGNYRGLYKFIGADSNQYIINLPSLIFTGSGENLETENTHPQAFFVINNGKNLVKPYNDVNTESVTGVLLQLTGQPVELRAIRIGEWNVQSGSLKDNLGYSEDEIGREIFGDKYPIDKDNLQVPLVVAWKDILGTDCENDDYQFTSQGGVSYRWAGCNSVLGRGFEWGDDDNGTAGTIWTCYSYNGINTVLNCPRGASGNAMYSSAKEKNWNEASSVSGTVNNIWGKLYTYSQAIGGACPNGWHLPSNEEWTALETHLYGRTCRTINDWECEGLGWSGNASKTVNNNIVQALKIPLSGYRYNVGVSFYGRGNNARLWSTTASSRFFYAGNNTIHRDTDDESYGFSVRCVKN